MATETKVTHTPGPWQLGSHADGIEIAAEDTDYGYMPLAMVWDGLGDEHDGEGEANARLIAAAPALLEALEDTDNIRIALVAALKKLSAAYERDTERGFSASPSLWPGALISDCEDWPHARIAIALAVGSGPVGAKGENDARPDKSRAP